MRLTYFDGATPSQPPDNRATAQLRRPGQVGSDPLTYQYVEGSDQLAKLVHGNSDVLVFEHDELGRRRADFVPGDHASRREYRYLPNGLLGTIVGFQPDGSPYSVSLNYDEFGRLLTVTRAAASVTTYELFYDDNSRVIAVAISEPNRITRWHYHYVASQPVAATREVSEGPNPAVVDRYWFAYDERGLVHRVLNHQGFEYFRADYDASGWRATEVEADGFWMPFGLPGQFVVRGTSASSQFGVRPELAIHGVRAYDAFTGRFLTPDPVDLDGRLAPEGYAYARNSPVAAIDPRGTKTEWFNDVLGPGRSFFFDSSCGKGSSITTAIVSALEQVAKCDKGLCGMAGGAALRFQWIRALYFGYYRCPGFGERACETKGVLTICSEHRVDTEDEESPGFFRTSQGTSRGFTPHASISQRQPSLAPAGFGSYGTNCLTKTVAHEALHTAFHTVAEDTLLRPPHESGFDSWWFRLQQLRNGPLGAASVDTYAWRTTPVKPKENPVEKAIDIQVGQCIDCR